MAGESHLETTALYTESGCNDPADVSEGWRGDVKVRIRVPLDMPPPREIMGVVLTPEVSRCSPTHDGYNVSGWVDAVVYYQPHTSKEQSMGYEREIGPEEAIVVPPRSQSYEVEFDDYFLDLEHDKNEELMEIMGVGKEVQLVGEENKGTDEKPLVNSLTSRVPFSLNFSNLGTEEVPVLSPQVYSVECLISGRRLVDLEVAIDLLASEEDPVESSAAEAEAEEIISSVIPDDADLEFKGAVELDSLVKQAGPEAEEYREETEDFFIGDDEEIESVEVIPEFDHPVLGLGYRTHSSPRRPGRNRRWESPFEDTAVRPRPLAKPVSMEAAPVETEELEEIRASKRSGRRQTTLMRFHFDG